MACRDRSRNYTYVSDPRRNPREELQKYVLISCRETEKTLGSGSFATVVEVEYKGLRCAGKKLHPILVSNWRDSSFVARFLEECNLLNGLRHPNIVQFLGIYFDPSTNAPVLVMENLPGNLTQLLDRYGVLEDELTYPILRDVALALWYLHDRRCPIIHRDLTVNNILLASDMTAKVSDLGVAKILKAIDQNQAAKQTPGPGTPCYMPPEALGRNPQYNVKVDIFSFGILIIHILSGKWPVPDAVFCTVDREYRTVDREYGDEDYCTTLNEVQRRKKYLDMIAPSHPLRKVIEQCLEARASKRPTAKDLFGFVAHKADKYRQDTHEIIKQTTANRKEESYLKAENKALKAQQEDMQRKQDLTSVENVQLRLQIASLRADMKHKTEMLSLQLETSQKMEQVVLERQAELIAKRTRLYQAKIEEQEEEHKQQFKLKDARIDSLKAELKLKDELVSRKETAVDDFEAQLAQAKKHRNCAAKYNLLDPRCKVEWEELLTCPPYEMCGTSAVLIGNTVYMGGGEMGSDKREGEYVVLRYVVVGNRWSALRPAPVRRFALVKVKGRLVIIGGIYKSYTHATADVHVHNETTGTWEKSIPPMIIACASPTAASYDNNVIACGGIDPTVGKKTAIEVYRSDVKEWCLAKPLPILLDAMSSVVVGDLLFLVGGYNALKPHTVHGTDSAVYASITELMKSVVPTATEAGAPEGAMWHVLPGVPSYQCSVATIGGCLLCVGGSQRRVNDRRASELSETSSIYIFCRSSFSWIELKSLPMLWNRCSAICLSANELLVVGSKVQHGSRVASSGVFKASITFSE